MSKEKLSSNVYKKIFDVQHECSSVIKDPKKGLQYKPTVIQFCKCSCKTRLWKKQN